MATLLERQRIHQAHDRFARHIFSDINRFRSFLQARLPKKLLHQTDLTHLRPLPTVMVSEILGGTEAIADLLFETRLNGHTGLLYFLLEHKSYPDKFTVLQAQVYQVCAWWQYHKNHPGKPLPMIYTMILHHGKHPYLYDTDIRALIDAPRQMVDDYLFKPFQLIDLTIMSDTELTAEGPEDLQLVELILKHITDKDILTWLRGPAAKLMTAVVQKDKRLAFAVLEYVVRAGRMNDDQLKAYVNESITPLSPELGEAIVTPISSSMRKGRQQGLQEGSQKARQEVALAMVALGIDEEVIIKVTGLSNQQLQLLKQKALEESAVK